MKKVLLIVLLLSTILCASAKANDDDQVWAALPCSTWSSMGLEGPPWCQTHIFLPIVRK